VSRGGAEGHGPDCPPGLTRWQAARRRRRGLVDRIGGMLFGIIAAAMLWFFVALGQVVWPALVG
jgi:hypothetical protein